jgi:hypothetical protein
LVSIPFNVCLVSALSLSPLQFAYLFGVEFPFLRKKLKIFGSHTTPKAHLIFGKVFFFHRLGISAFVVHRLEVCHLLSVFLFIMEPRDLMELIRILRTHEDMVQENRYSIFSLIYKFMEFEQQCMAQLTKIMNTLLRVKQQLAILETKCNLLKNMIEFMNNDVLLIIFDH